MKQVKRIFKHCIFCNRKLIRHYYKKCYLQCNNCPAFKNNLAKHVSYSKHYDWDDHHSIVLSNIDDVESDWNGFPFVIRLYFHTLNKKNFFKPNLAFTGYSYGGDLLSELYTKAHLVNDDSFAAELDIAGIVYKEICKTNCNNVSISNKNSIKEYINAIEPTIVLYTLYS
jgi:hypothetical protein